MVYHAEAEIKLFRGVHSAGQKTSYNMAFTNVNRHLKWAFVEAANVVCRNRNRGGWGRKHLERLYRRIRERREHPKAIGAIARHSAAELVLF